MMNNLLDGTHSYFYMLDLLDLVHQKHIHLDADMF